MSEPEPQILTLTVTGSQAAALGPRSRKMFVGKDGSIGRAEDCDWVLNGAGVSRVHAMIRYVNGLYFVEDRSTNGMLLNGSTLLKGEPSALKDGDRLQIDAFDIAIHMAQDSETIVHMAPPVAHAAAAPYVPPPAPLPPAPSGAAVPASFDAALLDFGLPPLGAPASAPMASPAPMDSLIPDAPATPGGSLDPLSFLDGLGAPAPIPPAPAPSPSAWNHSAGTADYFRPPTTDVQRQSGALPDNWDDDFSDLVAPPAAPVAPAAPAPVVAPPVAAAPVAAPAVAPASASTAPTPEIDAMFRIVVDGVMDVLRARAEIKNTFRLPMTVIQKSENNPLKFAMGVDEAMQKLLAPSTSAFLSGTAAFEDAFDDIRCHQMAMLAGVRAGFDALLRHFDPERFEHEADAGGRHAFGGKGRYWERYREHYAGLAGDPDECFRRLFGDEFARAYEEQLAKLKSVRRAQAQR